MRIILFIFLIMGFVLNVFAEEMSDYDSSMDKRVYCQEVWKQDLSSLYNLYIKAKRMKSVSGEFGSDQEIGLKFLKNVSGSPEIIEEAAYLGGIDEASAKELFTEIEVVADKTISVFFDLKGNLRELRTAKGSWAMQCENGNFDELIYD